MKGVFLLTILLAAFATLCAQIHVDSSGQNAELSREKSTIDSLHTNLQALPNSLLIPYRRIDSIRNDFILAADNLQTKYSNSVSNIDEQTNRVNRSFDSLTQLNLPTGQYTKKLDSLRQLRQHTVTRFTSKLDSLKSRVTGKLNALDLPPEYRGPVEKLTQNVNGLNLNAGNMDIPELKIPGYELPRIDNMPQVPSLNGADNPAAVANLPKLETPAGDLGDVSGKLQGYQADVQKITDGDITNVDKLPETIESEASKIEGIDEIQKQSGVLDEHKAQLDNLADPEQAKQKAVETAKKAAVDHFAGKEEQLKAAMEKISKYKQKYSSVSSIRDLPKRPPNPMKGKPFVERLIPGVYFQYQQKNFYLLDVNPYIGYRLTGRFNLGVGWNHRYARDSKQKIWNDRSRIFGPRAYVDFKLGKGFIAHIEGESMNTFVPSAIHGNPDSGQREWVWSCMTGIKKEYKIYKNLKGTALIQYNLFNRYYKAPYVDRLNSRIGFEYVLKKKPHRSAKN